MLHQINDQVVHLFVEHLRVTLIAKKRGQPVSSYTLDGYVRVIKSFLNWCLLDEEYSKQIQAIAVKRIQAPQVIETIIETFTSQHIAALFEACQREESEHLQLRDEAIIAVLLDSGLRADELVKLTIGNISTDPRDPYVKVLGKGKHWGEVGLGERARKVTAKYIRMFREPTIEDEIRQANPRINDQQLKHLLKQELPQKTVFMNRYANPLRPNGLYQIFDRLGTWAGISPDEVRCSPHTCRHTFAVNFIRQGGDIYTLSKLLRHSSVKVTEEYLKSLKQSEARRGAKSVLDNM
jgi:integrase/recombinase XerD